MSKLKVTSDRILVFYQRAFPEPMSGCWLWIGGDATNGYGSFSLGGAVTAHRASWMIHNGPIPDGLHVLHKCDVRLCVNPDHLFLGTGADNMQDCVRKGRFHYHAPVYLGDDHPMAKLDWEKVAFIRSSSESTARLARIFNVSETAVRLARKHKTWKNA